jgi:hypothetical protein
MNSLLMISRRPRRMEFDRLIELNIVRTRPGFVGMRFCLRQVRTAFQDLRDLVLRLIFALQRLIVFCGLAGDFGICFSCGLRFRIL